LSSPFIHRLSRAAFIAAAIACVQPRIAAAQSVAEVQVRAVADSFFAAGAAERWAVAAKLLDMDAFDKTFKQMQGNVRAGLPGPPLTVESLMAQDSTMTRAVAEWQIARYGKDPRDPYEFLSYEFARVTTPRELLALTRDEGAARWLEAQDFRYKLRLAWKHTGCPGDMPATMLTPERHTVVGIAIGNDSTAYVVYTSAGGMYGADASPNGFPPSVIVVNRRGSTWRINPNFTQQEGGSSFVAQCGK
jgi:hypothetical protein